MAGLTGRKLIASRCAKFFKDGDFVNLGIGVPLMCVNYLPEGVDLWLEAEIGTVGSGPTPSWDKVDIDVIDAGGQPASVIKGGSVYDHEMSFAFIRGGHIDAAVLGTLQVDQEGNIANWMIPGKMVPGMGGAMDLCAGVKKIIVATDHCEKSGKSKILKKCTLPLTGVHCVTDIVTERCYFEVTKDPHHPFHVNTKDRVTIEVLGTSFNVRSYPDETKIETVLEEGSVRMSKGKEKVTLSPGYKAVYQPEKGIETTSVNTELYTAWRHGQYIFVDESVENILKQLSRWYNIEVFYSNEKAKSVIFSGDVRKYNDITTLLEAMEIAGGIHFKINGNTLIVSYKE